MSKYNLLMLIGGIMLFNPVVAVFDVLPDAIGFLLLAIGLFPYSKAEMALADARKMAFALSGIELVKLIISPVIVMSLYADDKLLATAAFAIVECIFGTIFVNHYFSGMSYIADRHGNGLLSARYSEDTAFIKLFWQLRVWLPVIPELTALASDASHDDALHYDDLVMLAGMRSILVAFAVLIGLVLGVIYIAKICKMFSASLKENGLREYISVYENYIKNDEVRYERRAKISRFVATIGAVCFFDLIIDDAPVIVPAYGMLLLVISLLLLGTDKRHLKGIFVMLLCSFAELASEILKISTVDSSIIDILQVTPEVMLKGAALSLISEFSWVVFAVLFIKVYNGIVYERYKMRISFAFPLLCAALMLIIRCLGMILPNMRMWTPTVYSILAIAFAFSSGTRFYRTAKE